jgi:hypothetical protein
MNESRPIRNTYN